MEQVIVIRPELQTALFELWGVNNWDDLLKEIANYELIKEVSRINTDPTLTIFHEPKATGNSDGK